MSGLPVRTTKNSQSGKRDVTQLQGQLRGGLIESGVDVVDRDRVIGVRCIAAHIYYHPQRPVDTSSLDGLVCHKAGDLAGEVDTVHKYVD